MAIATDTVSQGTATSTSLTIAHTISGTDTILIVGVWNTGGDIITGATFNGVAMALSDKIQRGDGIGRWGYLFYLIAPATGTHNIVVSASGSTTFFGYGASYTGALQTGQPDNHGTNTANATSLYKTLTSVANGCWHIGLFFNQNQVCSAGTGTSQRSVSASGDGIYDSNAAKTPAGNTAIGVTVASTDQLACCTATFSPSAITLVSNGYSYFL